MKLLRVHRLISIFVVIFTAYLAITGSLIDMIDLKGLLTTTSPYDLNLQAMGGDPTGPGDYAVIGPVDYTAASLPVGADYATMFATTLKAAHGAKGDALPLYAELRMARGKPVGVVQFNDDTTPKSVSAPARPGAGGEGMGPRGPQHTVLAFDPVSGAALPLPELSGRNREVRTALRVQVKSLHRFTTYGNWALWINLLVGPALLALLVTGTIVYARQYRARFRMERKGLFWQGQDWWRTLHRSLSVVFALFLTIVALSGVWLAVESLIFGQRLSAQMAQMRAPSAAGPRKPGMKRPVDPMSPLAETDVPQWLGTTLAAYQADRPGEAPRVIRLRVYANYAQGVVVSGGHEAEQIVYNASTGSRMSETEPGYPKTPFPFGWQAHQWAKAVHNGSLIGLTGRWISLLSGLCLAYLSISGIVMYLRLWRRRVNNGKKAFLW